MVGLVVSGRMVAESCKSGYESVKGVYTWYSLEGTEENGRMLFANCVYAKATWPAKTKTCNCVVKTSKYV